MVYRICCLVYIPADLVIASTVCLDSFTLARVHNNFRRLSSFQLSSLVNGTRKHSNCLNKYMMVTGGDVMTVDEVRIRVDCCVHS